MTKRILIFNVNWLGDVLFSTATIRNIKRNFPQSFIACVIPSRCYPILKDNPYLDEIIIFDDKDRHKGLFAKLNFVKILKDKKFDLVFLLHRSFRRALICRLAGIPERIGHHTKKRGFLLTKKIIPPRRDSLHRIDYYLNIIKKAGLIIEDRHLDFFFSEEDEEYVSKFFEKNSIRKYKPANKKDDQKEDFLVVINPGGNWSPKRWPPEYWAELSDRLIDEYAARVIVTGSTKDQALAKSITKLMKNELNIACGVFNVKHLGALCAKADLFITADTGPLHIANAVRAKKIIALFGPTSPKITGPYPQNNVILLQKDSGCKIPCYKVHCKDNRCMKLITPDEVIKEIKAYKGKVEL